MVKKISELAGSGKILVMDDEEYIRDLITEILELIGYSVESCAEGKEAVELFRSARQHDVPFEAVILDLTIPGGMGGKDAAVQILEIDPDALLIVSSGYSNDSVIANYRQYGFSDAIPKPFNAAAMARVLERLIPKITG